MKQSLAAAGGTEVLEAGMNTSSRLGLHAHIEHVMQLQNGEHHHCMANRNSALFAYLALNKANSNLAMPGRLRNVDDGKPN